MRLVIVTGLSGAGKTAALHYLEDMGYFCVDNLPTQLLEQFIDLCMQKSNGIQQAAIVVDVRGGRLFDIETIYHVLNSERAGGCTFELLFMDASDESLIARYKETRRDHPLAHNLPLAEGIKRERDALQPLKEIASAVLDTTGVSTRTLRATMVRLFSGEAVQQLRVEVMSFGFKRGVPRDADMVFDVRFLPNPFYIPSMRTHTGKDADVRDYVLDCDDTSQFMAKLEDMFQFLLPRFISEGKNRLLVAVGCTGGQHRSVAIAEALYEFFLKGGYSASIFHRDMDDAASGRPYSISR